ncbi:MAG TPA: NAD(+) synthase [Gammaproteobacteria bacterium]|nr:NAD(+) synthase [Gammaproteobacteria bacterium]HIK69824.1 NAD(+) synthase [Pseudomonadales bacterium]
MRVCLGQINTTPGDFSGNVERIKQGIVQAADQQCDAIIFPELSIPGYLSQDLIYSSGYVDANLQALQEIVSFSGLVDAPDLHVLVGYIEPNPAPGKPYFNAAAVVRKGKVLTTYHKMLLPFYDVFDELRYFQAGDKPVTFEIGDQTVGIAICEDLWNDKGQDDYSYSNNPLAVYRQKEVDLVFALNSSPYIHNKCQQRLDALGSASLEMAIVYVNQWGGQDELVFDGQSFVMANGELLFLSEELNRDEFAVVELPAGQDESTLDNASPITPGRNNGQTTRSKPPIALYDMLRLGLRDYVLKSGFSSLVFASSGGVDSALVGQLACDAIGAENVHGVRLPSIFSSEHSRTDAVLLHEQLGCWDYEVPIEHEALVEMLNNQFRQHEDPENLVHQVFSGQHYGEVADQNIQARLRDLYVMHFSNAYGAMPLSTGNKTESACGYYTHFDMNFSFAPIKDLYKREVFALARSSERIPSSIWMKPPSAELAEGQLDEQSLLPYAVLDPLVQAYIEDYINQFPAFSEWVLDAIASGQTISSQPEYLRNWLKQAHSAVSYQRIVSLIGRMEYKRRQTCLGTKVSKVAFGIGRRIPIVEKWS